MILIKVIIYLVAKVAVVVCSPLQLAERSATRLLLRFGSKERVSIDTQQTFLNRRIKVWDPWQSCVRVDNVLAGLQQLG